MEGVPFAVVRRPYCLWDRHISQLNLTFIERLDSTYFEYVAETHFERVDTDDRNHASVSLRSGYHHGLETFFMLLGACVQAPECVVGWFQKAQPRHVREVLRSIDTYQRLPNRLGLDRLSWRAIADRVLLFSYEDAEKLTRTRESFAVLWSRLATDYQNDLYTREYNSMKHGLRVRPGGFELRVGLEETPGVAAPPENMKSLGASLYGSSFYVASPVDGAPSGRLVSLVYESSELHDHARSDLFPNSRPFLDVPQIPQRVVKTARRSRRRQHDEKHTHGPKTPDHGDAVIAGILPAPPLPPKRQAGWCCSVLPRRSWRIGRGTA